MAEIPDALLEAMAATAAEVKAARANWEAADERQAAAFQAHRAAASALDKHVAGLVRRDPAKS